MAPQRQAPKPKQKRPPGLAPEANPKAYNRKTGYYGYPLTDYAARGGGYGATNPLQAALLRQGKK